MNLKIETFTPSPAENWMYQQKLQGKNTIANWELVAQMQERVGSSKSSAFGGSNTGAAIFLKSRAT